MERIDLDPSELTLAQKIDLMEAIGDDFVKHEQSFESPHWHENILKDREDALRAGKATVSDWSQAKDWLRKNASCE